MNNRDNSAAYAVTTLIGVSIVISVLGLTSCASLDKVAGDVASKVVKVAKVAKRHCNYDVVTKEVMCSYKRVIK